jgi:hypothetical protein
VHVQCLLSGGPYTMTSHGRQCQVVCPPPPCPRQNLMTDENLAAAELVTVWASHRWVGDPLAVRGLHQLAQHDLEPRRSWAV